MFTAESAGTTFIGEFGGLNVVDASFFVDLIAFLCIDIEWMPCIREGLNYGTGLSQVVGS